MVLLNDGTLGFAEGVDPTKHMLGSCSISFRNTENPVLLKVTYKENTLSVSSSKKKKKMKTIHDSF